MLFCLWGSEYKRLLVANRKEWPMLLLMINVMYDDHHHHIANRLVM